MHSFQIFSHPDKTTRARLGKITTAHGEIQTPVFMPVGTKGTVKAMTPQRLKTLNAQVILGNTYHLYLRPGHELVREAGGLHRFMAWDKPILTDSGGFQVYSLTKIRKVTEEGVAFQSHIDGSRHVLTPELSIAIQEALGADIMMCFDECPALPAERAQIEKSMELTLRWEERCLKARERRDNALFAIVQGGTEKDLRAQCLERLIAISEASTNGFCFEGYALGGLSVGEANEVMYEVVSDVAPLMPEDKPRYLMGVGTPEDLVTCVDLGIDMFDCVMPTRNARNGMLFTDTGDLQIKQAAFTRDFSPVMAGCSCYTCQNFSRAYLRHLYLSDEILASILNTIHNLHYYIGLLDQCRLNLRDGTFTSFKKTFFGKRT